MNRKIFTLFCVLFAFSLAFAENYAPLGLTGSKMKYKFSVSKEVMYDYQKNKLKEFPIDDLGTPVDSIPFDEKIPDNRSEKRGTYVWCWFEKGHLMVKPVNNPPFYVFVCQTDNGNTLVKVVDDNARNIEDAVVKYNGKLLKFNPENGSYFSRSNSAKHSEVTVEHDGYIKQYSQKVSYNRPKKAKDDNVFANSFFTTDKPEYRKGDTLRWKAVVVNLSGKWYNEALTLSASAYYGKKITIGEVQPQKPGVFYGEFILNDSIKGLILGNRYNLSLTNTDKKGRENEVVTTHFLYRDYELKSLKTEIMTPDRFVVGKDFIVKEEDDGNSKKVVDRLGIEVVTKDERGNAVMSGTIRMTYNINSPSEFKADYVWYPDTAFSVEVPISTSGRTFVPMDLPQLSDGTYYVSVELDMATADYEKVSAHRYFPVVYDRDADAEKLLAADEPKEKAVKYPEIVKIHSVDSVGFVVGNCGMELLYAIYKDGKLLKTATADSIDWRIRTCSDGKYDLFLFFKPGDSEKYTKYAETIEHSRYSLDVKVEQPEVVAPGEKARIRIYVTDAKGRPVEGADVLAHAYTDKFSQKPQGVRMWKRPNAAITPYYYFYNFEDKGKNTATTRSDFDDELLALFRLSTSDYYRFLYPDTDKFTVSIADKKGSQIAPFVVKNGDIEPVVYLVIDGNVVYSGIAENEQKYSFPVKPGKHNVEIHTIDGDYYLRNLKVEEGSKLWVSVPYDIYDKEDKNTDVYADKRKNGYSTKDIKMLVRSGLTLKEVKPVAGWPYLFADGNVSLLTKSASYGKYHSGLFFVPYNFTACRYREQMYGQTFDLPFHNSVCEYQHIIEPRDSTSFVEDYNSAIRQHYSVISPDYNDTLVFESDLDKFWLDIIDNYRKYTVMNDLPYNKSNVYVVKDRTKDEHCKTVLNYVVETADSVTYYNGNTNLLQLPYGEEATIYGLYKNAEYFTYTITVSRGGRVCIKLPADSLLLPASEKSRAFENDIRRKIQDQIIKDRGEGFYNYVGYQNPFVSRKSTGLTLSDRLQTEDYDGAANFKIRGVTSIAYSKANGASLQKTNKDVLFEESITEDATDYRDELPFEEEEMLRSDFRDVAYWVPSAVTDESGMVEIEVDYPEDLTRWAEEFVAMKGKYRGSRISFVTVQKDVTAKLSIPRFAVEGDSIRFIGQATNYTSDTTLLVERAFRMSKGKEVLAKDIFTNSVVAHTVTDYLSARIPLLPTNDNDTLTVVYSLSSDRISDGELRKLPVYPQGMSAVDAMFAICEKGDTSFTYTPDKAHGSVTLYAQTDIISLLYDELDETGKADIDKCSNERLAQVLKTLILKKEFCDKKGVRFDDDKKVNKIIKKLEKNCSNGKWGWWNKAGYVSMDITKSVYEALVLAGRHYTVSILEQNTYRQDYFAGYYKARTAGDYYSMLDYAELFDILGWKSEALSAIDDIPADTLRYNNILRYQKVKARCGGSVDFAAFDTIRYKDLLGGEYYTFRHYPVWARLPQYDFYFDIESTLMVYEITTYMPSTAERARRLVAMKRWLLQNRETQRYIGERLSTEILCTIADDLLKDSVAHRPASIIVRSGNNEYRVSNFPYTVNLTPDYPITIVKSGDSEAYISLSQRYWQKQTEAKSGDISIKTYVKGGKDLTLGKEVTLVVEVDLSADAEYLLVHAPIPAGCSYSDYQPYNYKVTHREDFAHAVNFYIERLKAGKHDFEIKLLPRWSGNYHLNPATAELYYYPAFNANEKGKEVRIVE